MQISRCVCISYTTCSYRYPVFLRVDEYVVLDWFLARCVGTRNNIPRLLRKLKKSKAPEDCPTGAVKVV